MKETHFHLLSSGSEPHPAEAGMRILLFLGTSHQEICHLLIIISYCQIIRCPSIDVLYCQTCSVCYQPLHAFKVTPVKYNMVC